MKEPVRLIDRNEQIAGLIAKHREPEPSSELLSAVLASVDRASSMRDGSRAHAPRGYGRLGLGLGGLAIVGAMTFAGVRASLSSPAPDTTSVSASVEEPVETRPTGAPSEAAQGVSVSDLPEPPRAARSAPFAITSSHASTPKPPSPRREIELILAARRALSNGDAGACLSAVDLYDREFARGQLALEAQVMRVEALRATGERARATVLARDLLTENPESPYEARLRSVLSSMENR